MIPVQAFCVDKQKYIHLGDERAFGAMQRGQVLITILGIAAVALLLSRRRRRRHLQDGSRDEDLIGRFCCICTARQVQAITVAGQRPAVHWRQRQRSLFCAAKNVRACDNTLLADPVKSIHTSPCTGMVGWTSRFCAAARALETQQPDALYQDPLAEALAGKDAMEEAQQRTTIETVSVSYLCRAHARNVLPSLLGLTCFKTVHQIPWACRRLKEFAMPERPPNDLLYSGRDGWARCIAALISTLHAAGVLRLLVLTE